MKCAIVILALVAVSQAAFTNKLQQRARPILSDAITKMHSVSGRSSFRESEITSSIISALQDHADSLLSQIDTAVQQGQAFAETLVQEFQNTVGQLQALGANVHAQASGVLSELLSTLGGLFSGFGGLFGEKSGVVSQTVIDLINQFQLDHHVSNLLSNNYVQFLGQWIAGLLNQLQYTEMVQTAVNSVLGSELGEYILGHFKPQGNQNGKGLFDGLASVGSSLTAAAQQALANIGNTISQIVNVATTNFEQLQQLATQFVQEGLVQAQATAAQAAQQLLDYLKPYQQDLGELYQQVVAQVSAVINV